MFLRRAEKKVEHSILNLYPALYVPSPDEKVYFFLHSDGSHVLQKSGQPKCIILSDSELPDYLYEHHLRLTTKSSIVR